MTPDQQEFYGHLQRVHPHFEAKHTGSYAHLAHLRTPAERYKNLCENYEPPRFKKERTNATT